MKQSFLVVHDYGAGGLWGIMSATSEEAISTKFPGLKVVRDRPSWMSDDEYRRIEALFSFDIDDDPPKGWLAKL